MLSLETMFLRFLIAAVCGGIIGLERELSGKEAGIRTNITVASGAALFTMVGLSLPYLVALTPENLADTISHNSGFLGVIANIVVGVGFLGAGIIVKQGMNVRGLTTAATVWFVAAVGVLAGIGLAKFSLITAISLTVILWSLRHFDLYRFIGKPQRDTSGEDEL